MKYRLFLVLAGVLAAPCLPLALAQERAGFPSFDDESTPNSEGGTFDPNQTSDELMAADESSESLSAGEWVPQARTKSLEGASSLPPMVPLLDLSRDLLAPVIDGGDSVPSTMWSAIYYVHSYAVARHLGLTPGQARTIKFVSNPHYIYEFKKAANPRNVSDVTIATAFEWVAKSGCASYAEMAKLLNTNNQPPREAIERSYYNAGGEIREIIRSQSGEDTTKAMDQIHRFMSATRLPIALSIRKPPDWAKTPQQWIDYIAKYGKIYHSNAQKAEIDRWPKSCVTIIGYNSKAKATKIVGSWGRGWGKDGFLWVNDALLARMTGTATTLDLGDYRLASKLRAKHIAAGREVAPNDYALVVGVNNYPRLSANLGQVALKGCENDANAVAASFKELGWNMSALTGAQATKTNILAEIAKIKDQITPTGRFVFYFAGHGSRDAQGNPVVLPVDALPDSDRNDLTPGQLDAAVSALNTNSKSVVIDACFAGGFAGQEVKPLDANLMRLASTRGRFVWRPQLKTERQANAQGGKARLWLTAGGQAPARATSKAFNPPVNGSDVPSFQITNRGISQNQSQTPTCYLVASHSNQTALEWPDQSVVHGAFTRNLLRYISGRGRTWGAVSTSIARNLSRSAGGQQQQPCLTAGFYKTGMFERLDSPPLGTQNRLDVGTVADPSVIKLVVRPDHTRFKIGDKLNFQVEVNPPGYIVLLNKGAGGTTSLLYPVDRSAIAVTQPGDPLGSDGAYFSLEGPVGEESYTAYWFKDKRAVEALFGVFEARRLPQTKPKTEDEDKIYRAPHQQFQESFDIFLKQLREGDYKPTIITSSATINVE